MSVRAKFRCNSITEFEHGKQVKLNAVYGNGKENESWSKATPSGALEMTITNPEAYKQFEVGKEYFLDFAPAIAPAG